MVTRGETSTPRGSIVRVGLLSQRGPGNASGNWQARRSAKPHSRVLDERRAESPAELMEEWQSRRLLGYLAA